MEHSFRGYLHTESKGGYVLAITKTAEQIWKIEKPAANGNDLLKHGNELECKFRLTTPRVANQYAFAFYWQIAPADVPQGITFTDRSVPDTLPCVMNFFIQTDGTNINLMVHKSPTNLKMGTFGAYNTDWPTLKVVYHCGNTNRATLHIDGNNIGDISLMNCPENVPLNAIQVTSIVGMSITRTGPPAFFMVLLKCNKYYWRIFYGWYPYDHRTITG